MKKFIIITLIIIIAILLVVAIIGSIITGRSLDDCFFGACCGIPMNDAFDLCYRELIQLAKDCHTTYNNVNYAIFILLFLVITIGNILLVKLLDFISTHLNCKSLKKSNMHMTSN